MKLTTNYNRVNIFTSTVVLICTGIIYYLFIHSILTDKLDKDLDVEEDEIQQYVATYHKLPLPASFINQQVAYSEFDPRQPEREFRYTSYIDPKDKDEEPGRSLFTTVKVGEVTYRVIITKSRVEAEDLVRVILLITLGVLLLLLTALLLINRFFFNRLWKSFYSILQKMKSFEVTRMTGIREEATNIDEFIELNASVNAMAEKVHRDYRELKSFTDNASHEMMTPLAVINSKLDSLLQTEKFTQKQGELLQDIYQATGRLSRLNQSLLLLAKIENNLISDVQQIDMADLVSSKLRQFQELFERDDLQITSDIDKLEVRMSKYLADILLNNLISNAVRHNLKGGSIDLSLKGMRLTVSNTGNSEKLESNSFDRFAKSSHSEGMGLGLAITRQICNLYHFDLGYEYHNDRHLFLINFSSIS